MVTKKGSKRQFSEEELIRRFLFSACWEGKCKFKILVMTHSFISQIFAECLKCLSLMDEHKEHNPCLNGILNLKKNINQAISTNTWCPVIRKPDKYTVTHTGGATVC